MKHVAALIFLVAVLWGCDSSSPRVDSAPVPATPSEKPATASEEAKPAPADDDLPVPPAMSGQSQSSLPGSAYRVVQGTIGAAMPEATESVRQAASSKGWVEVPSNMPAGNSPVTTISFEKGDRQARATLTRTTGASTGFNLLYGPK